MTTTGKWNEARLERALIYTGRRIFRATNARHQLLWVKRRERIAWLLINRYTLRLGPKYSITTTGTQVDIFSAEAEAAYRAALAALVHTHS